VSLVKILNAVSHLGAKQSGNVYFAPLSSTALCNLISIVALTQSILVLVLSTILEKEKVYHVRVTSELTTVEQSRLDPSSLPIVVAQFDKRHANRTASMLKWYVCRDGYFRIVWYSRIILNLFFFFKCRISNSKF